MDLGYEDLRRLLSFGNREILTVRKAGTSSSEIMSNDIGKDVDSNCCNNFYCHITGWPETDYLTARGPKLQTVNQTDDLICTRKKRKNIQMLVDAAIPVRSLETRRADAIFTSFMHLSTTMFLDKQVATRGRKGITNVTSSYIPSASQPLPPPPHLGSIYRLWDVDSASLGNCTCAL